MRKILQVHKGNREVDWTAADIAMACSAPDAEELVRRASGGVLDANYGQYSIFPESPRARLAWFLLKRGDRAGAEKMLADAERQATEHWRAGIESGALAVELAAIMSMRGDADQAVTWMQRAFELGWREWIDNADPMLAPAASNPRFQAVVKQIQDDIRRQAAESLQLKALFEETVPSLPPPPHPAGNQPAPN